MTGAARTAASARRSTSSRSRPRPAADGHRARGRTAPPTSAGTPLRASILSAVDELARTRGWSATTMSDVAAVAGISRQTVYNEFGTRQALVQAYVVREIETLVAEVEDLVRRLSHDPLAALQAAFSLFLDLASDEPVVQIIVAGAEGGELIRLLTEAGRAVAAERVARLMVEVWPHAALSDARMLSDALVRLAISHALLPMADARVTAESITRLLGPFVDQVLGITRTAPGSASTRR